VAGEREKKVKPFDFVTFGETMIRLSPPNKQLLEQAASLDIHVGGSESNTAMTLARLGLRTAWVSKLVANPLGRKIASTLAAQGVDISGIVWTETGRNATYFVEFGAPPRPHRVTYDRKDSAINALKPAEVNWALFEKARVVHLTGITPALSDNCRRLVASIIEHARTQRSLISFDVNYRSKLWNTRRARRILEPLCSNADILFIGRDDAADIFGVTGEPERIVETLASRLGCPTVAVTLGRGGAICLHKGKLVRSRTFQTSEVDRLGAGDAFSAGFIFGYLTRNVEYAIEFAAAISALKFTIPGDACLITKADVEAVMDSGESKIQR
jgi:2-dehydro-3-deoxygluconokinase